MELKTASLGKRFAAVLVDLLICGAVSVAALVAALWGFARLWRDELGFLMTEGVLADNDPFFLQGTHPGLFIWLFVTVTTTGLLAMTATHFYFMFYENKTGATPGKKLMGIKVVSFDGTAISGKQALWRELGRWYVDFSFILPTLITLAVTKKRQRIGDLIAKTLVVENPARKTQG